MREPFLRRVQRNLLAPRPPRLSRPVALLLAPVAALLAVLMQLAVEPHPTIAPFVFVYLAVVVASWLGGRLVGMLSMALSVLATDYLFVWPFEQWSLSGSALTACGFFVVTATAIVLVCAAFRDALLQVEETAGKLRVQSDLLAQSENRFRQLADSMPQLVWTAEPDGSIDYYNQRYREFCGFDQLPDGDWSWQPVLHPEDRAATAEAWQTAVATGERYEIAHRIAHADGSYRWYLSRGIPMRDSSGAIIKWFGTATEIDDQKRAEAALREADVRKNQFLAVLSHELRNPLAPICNSVHLLARAAPDSEQATRAREVIDRQTQHMARLIEDLLDVTRISRGKIRLRPEDLRLDEVVRRAAEDHHELFRRRVIALGLQITEQPLAAHADPTRIAQIVGNLLHNAVKFTAPGGHTTLTLERRGEDEAVLRVRDDGAGIAPDVLPRLFEPFVQGDDSLDRSRGGLGLGLALVKGLAELHGGRVSARSDGPGRGAEIEVVLPVYTERAGAGAPAPAAAAARPSRRVLVIEDNVDAAESLRDVLELDGHAVAVAHDGPAGIEMARAFAPEILLCDIGLPGMDGYEVARTLRADPALCSIYRVAISGYVAAEDLERSAAAGFARHLAKPPDLEELERTLAEAPGPTRCEETGRSQHGDARGLATRAGP